MAQQGPNKPKDRRHIEWDCTNVDTKGRIFRLKDGRLARKAEDFATLNIEHNLKTLNNENERVSKLIKDLSFGDIVVKLGEPELQTKVTYDAWLVCEAASVQRLHVHLQLPHACQHLTKKHLPHCYRSTRTTPLENTSSSSGSQPAVRPQNSGLVRSPAKSSGMPGEPTTWSMPRKIEPLQVIDPQHALFSFRYRAVEDKLRTFANVAENSDIEPFFHSWMISDKAIEDRAGLNKLMRARYRNYFGMSVMTWRKDRLAKTYLEEKTTSETKIVPNGTKVFHEILVAQMLAGLADEKNHMIGLEYPLSSSPGYEKYSENCFLIDRGYALLKELSKLPPASDCKIYDMYLKQLHEDLSPFWKNLSVANECIKYQHYKDDVLYHGDQQMWPIPTIVILFVAWVSGSVVLSVIRPDDLIIVSCLQGAMTSEFMQVSDDAGKPCLIGHNRENHDGRVKVTAENPLTLFENFYKTGCSAIGAKTEQWEQYEKICWCNGNRLTGAHAQIIGISDRHHREMIRFFGEMIHVDIKVARGDGRVLITSSLVHSGMDLMIRCVDKLHRDKSFMQLDEFKILSADLDRHYAEGNCHEMIVELCALSRWMRYNWSEKLARILDQDLLHVHLWMSICKYSFTVVDESFCKVVSLDLEYRTRVYLPAGPFTREEREKRKHELEKEKKQEKEKDEPERQRSAEEFKRTLDDRNTAF